MNTELHPHPAHALPAVAPASWGAHLLPGLALAGLLAVGGMALGQIPALAHSGLSALTLAIVLGCWQATGCRRTGMRGPGRASALPSSSCSGWAWCSTACA